MVSCKHFEGPKYFKKEMILNKKKEAVLTCKLR